MRVGDPIGGRIKILVPITGTPVSRRAADVGIELAQAARAEITILYVAPGSVSSRGASERRRRVLEMRHEEAVLKEIVAFADHYDVNLRTQIRMSHDVSAAILAEAERARDTLIVVGVAVRPSDELLFGNIAGQLLDSSQSSLLVASVLIMDKPTAALGVPEQRRVITRIERVRRRMWVSSSSHHSLADIFAVSDRILVL